jgi:hypothetical protein
MARDYIPDPDADFSAWQQNFLAYAATHMADLGLTPEDLAGPLAAKDDWNAAYAGHNASQVIARTAAQLKNDKRAASEAALRPLARQLQASPTLSDDERRALGITVRGDNAAPAGLPATSPIARIDAAGRFRHTIRFTDAATPRRRARPAGVAGCEIWGKVGAPPTGPTEMTFLAMPSASPYIADYSGEDAGKTAYYMLRWVTTRGRKGPWSETQSATIAG